MNIVIKPFIKLLELKEQYSEIFAVLSTLDYMMTLQMIGDFALNLLQLRLDLRLIGILFLTFSLFITYILKLRNQNKQR